MTQDKPGPVDDEVPESQPVEDVTQPVPPPGAGFPPPGGFPPPPPGTGGFATRYGLVRPARGGGRMVAGVAGALGRATNTDPVLWRVLFAVLILAGGLGLFAYVVGWLLIPAEGDTGSPLESLDVVPKSRERVLSTFEGKRLDLDRENVKPPGD